MGLPAFALFVKTRARPAQSRSLAGEAGIALGRASHIDRPCHRRSAWNSGARLLAAVESFPGCIKILTHTKLASRGSAALSQGQQIVIFRQPHPARWRMPKV